MTRGAEEAKVGELILAGAVWVVTHLGLSSTGLRGVIVGAIGERGFQGVYSLVAAVSLVWLVMTYNATPQFDYLWGPDPALRMVPMIVMPFAFMFMLGGFMVRNPTAVGQEAQVKAVGEGSGFVRITRHPFQWSVVMWSVAHIIANGDTASLVFFGSLGLVSLLGGHLIDVKKARKMGADWDAFARATSNIPFAAILSGRNRLVLRELWLPALAGILVFGAAHAGHEWISGVSLIR
jgi:uncharacterized membrane protein